MMHILYLMTQINTYVYILEMILKICPSLFKIGTYLYIPSMCTFTLFVYS